MRSRTMIWIACFTIRHPPRGSAEGRARRKYCSNDLLSKRGCQSTADRLRSRDGGETQWPQCERLHFQSRRCVTDYLAKTTNRLLIRESRVTGSITFARRRAAAGFIASATRKLAG